MLPGLHHHFQALIKAWPTLPHIHVRQVVVVLVQPSSYPKIQPSAAEHVDHTVVFQQTDGVVERQEGHGSAQANACGQARRRGHKNGGIAKSKAGNAMLGAPYAIKAERLCCDNLLQHLLVIGEKRAMGFGMVIGNI